MLFRVAIGVVLTLGAVIGWVIAAGPSMMLGSIKDDYVATAEESGLDMSECKARHKTLLDPSGGMSQCVNDVYRGMQKQIDEIDNAEQNSASSDSQDAPQEEPPADASSE